MSVSIQRETSALVALALVVGVAGPLQAEPTGERGEREENTAAESKREELRRLQAKYSETGEAKYMFRRVLTLEEMGEYEFALEVLEEHRREFESSSDVDGVAGVEQRLRDRLNGSPGASEGSSGDALGWGLLGGGLAGAVGGSVPLVIAETQAKRLRCSPVSEGPNADGCGGVDEYRGLSRSEFRSHSDRVTLLRIVGIGVGTLGLGVASWGLLRLLVTDETRSPNTAFDVSGPRVSGAFWKGGGHLQLEIRFE